MLRRVFQDKGNGIVRVFTGWDLSAKKKVKKQFAKLSKKEQEIVEAAYHNMYPSEFDDLMTHASARFATAKSRSKSAKALRKKRLQLKQQLSK